MTSGSSTVSQGQLLSDAEMPLNFHYYFHAVLVTYQCFKLYGMNREENEYSNKLSKLIFLAQEVEEMVEKLD